ncbi:hypothetical protein BDN72DRAFT_906665 [Pluteus cervinus]|uniref:Uncharacterized protein n=1 Tax=Pluteus cervinus TaxID=181527 RepID=A0ACD2ZYP2_9AGAR|nr:hypothetical protein BDN72DRAFT_906665 [Pluteus cervinus]
MALQRGGPTNESYEKVPFEETVSSPTRDLFNGFMGKSNPNLSNSPSGPTFGSHSGGPSHEIQPQSPLQSPSPTSATVPTSLSPTPIPTTTPVPPPAPSNDKVPLPKRGRPTKEQTMAHRHMQASPTPPKPAGPMSTNPTSTKPSTSKGKNRAVSLIAANSSESDSDSDTPIKFEAETSQSTRWSNEDDEQLTDAWLAVDSPYWKYYVPYRSRFCKKIARKVFRDVRSPKSIERRCTILRQVYAGINAFENWTGNGSGDPDVNINERLALARTKSITIPKCVTDELYRVWMVAGGLYELFDNRIREDPTLTRPVDHHSGQISDSDPEIEDLDDELERPSKRLRQSTTPAGKAKLGGGSTSKPKPQKSKTQKVMIGAFLEKSTTSFETFNNIASQAETRRAKYQDHKRVSSSIQLCNTMLATPNQSDEVKAASQAKLLELIGSL